MDIEMLYAAALGYFLGSIPFGLLLTKAAGLGDVRSIGSGNIGATNVLRTGNKGLAAATLLLDLFKGFLPVFLAWQWFPDWVGLTAVFAILGHCFPVWLGFKGGKGVATLAGVCFGIDWKVGLVYAVLWLGLLSITRISSLSGMAAAVAAPLAAWVFGFQNIALYLAVIAALILWLHRTNIGRLITGTEPKVGSGA
ncbi:Glycerol-3-phosphate 1-O-acyltransferase [Alteripontixanthobacter maritimus]|uniref:Glycerol-3-phosphate acyltransferase n=1 Tax=Alteripontixanthobacter maritimus TaxID=2161824 RepID=A0A369Q411_9SPHN|nr:glycerol-3-phosphate 1-O-acyltransferase PlsY [Alteripontixanthobacter maritimus]RDC59623.1 Glycerol-3-phosphate 1-O-acyltransferase [Alteripontixanthobacter maritimus]